MTEVLRYVGPEGWGSTAYEGDAGIDLPITTEQVLEPGEFYDLPSGIKVEIPPGYYGRIAARSGALRNRRIRVYEGVIDSGFRGELFTFVEAVGPTATAVRPGDRLAQLIIQPVVRFPTQRVEELTASERGARGFGSSDRRSGVDPRVSIFPDQFITKPKTYLGGPIDFQKEGEREERIALLRERFPDLDYYDPKAACRGMTDPGEIIGKNNGALLGADIDVFLFPDPPSYGFGSPVEIELARQNGKRIIVWHNSDNVGVFLRWYWQQGVVVATDWRDFLRVLSEEIAKVTGG